MAKRSGGSTNTIPIPFLAAGIYAVLIVVLFMVSFKVIGIPIAAVGLFVVLEALLAALLNRVPLWIHGLVLIAHLVFGGIFSKPVFMILMAVLYVGAVCILYLLRRDY